MNTPTRPTFQDITCSQCGRPLEVSTIELEDGNYQDVLQCWHCFTSIPGRKIMRIPPVYPSATGNCNNRQPSTSPGVTMIALIEGFPGKGKSHEAIQKIAEKLFDDQPSSSSTTTQHIAQQPPKNQSKIQE